MAKKMKVCTKCGRMKPLSEFSKDKTKKEGLKTQCKDCMNKANAEWRAKRKKVFARLKREEVKMEREAEKRLKEMYNPKPAKFEVVIDKLTHESKPLAKSVKQVAKSVKGIGASTKKVSKDLAKMRREACAFNGAVLFAKITNAVYAEISACFGLRESDAKAILAAILNPKSKKKK